MHILNADLEKNISQIKNILHQTSDLEVRNIRIGVNSVESTVLYLQSLTNAMVLQEHILFPLLYGSFHEDQEPPVTVGKIERINSIDVAISALLEGNSILLIQGKNDGYQFETKGWMQRSLQNTQNELSIKGTQQSLIESMNPNISLIRRYIPYSDLIINEINIAKKNKLSILYLKNNIDENVLKELQERLSKIHVDMILNTGELVEWIEDDTYSPFPQFLITERPDWIAKHLREGRITLILDNSSQAIIIPVNFLDFFKNIDDYGFKWYIASFMRALRFISFFISVFLPAIYVAAISYNCEIIPIQLLLSVAESRAKVPFPPILEAGLMLLSLELMREAAIRLPTPIGVTIGIVSGTIIGQAAVQAGIVSNIMVIVIGITALASYSIPSYDMGITVSVLRLPLMILASCFGLIGITVGWMILLAHLINLKSLNIPYGIPIVPLNFLTLLKDSLLRLPIKWIQKKRNEGVNIDKNR
ncbi:MAG: spore germination protein [Bacillus sp. (in: firmicutes)]|uniref:spore germination protein n=1 Tax=Bacillus sp. TaxID=1409 RepID=UPI0039E4CC14